MTKLLIIGNGFDISHGLKTTYNDFRKYLIKEKEIQSDYLVIPNAQTLPDGEIAYDNTEVLSMLFYVISLAESITEYWCNIEDSLAYLDFSEAFEYAPEVYDKDGDVDLWKKTLNNEDISSSIVIPSIKIQKLFSEWVNQIEILSVEKIQDLWI